jgi:hypothetical protein
VERIDALFAIKRETNGAASPERVRVRNMRSRPLVGALETWLRERRAKLSGKSETAKAIDYSLKRWPAFTRFLDDGRLCMSNNAAERAVRCVAVGRKNWTFAGSDEGGHRAAAIYTLIEHFDRSESRYPVANSSPARSRLGSRQSGPMRDGNSANALLMPDRSRRCAIRLPRRAYDALSQQLLEGAYSAAMFASPVKPTLSDWSCTMVLWSNIHLLRGRYSPKPPFLPERHAGPDHPLAGARLCPPKQFS